MKSFLKGSGYSSARSCAREKNRWGSLWQLPNLCKIHEVIQQECVPLQCWLQQQCTNNSVELIVV